MASDNALGTVGIVRPTTRSGGFDDLLQMLPNGIGVLHTCLSVQRGTLAEFKRIMSGEGQECIVNLSGQYPANKKVKAKAGRPALSSIKTLQEDPAAVEKMADEIKAKYARIFKV